MTYNNENMMLLSVDGATVSTLDTTQELKTITDTLAALPEKITKAEAGKEAESLESAKTDLGKAADQLDAVIADLVAKELDKTDKDDMEIIEVFNGHTETIAMVRIELESGTMSVTEAIEKLEAVTESVTVINTELRPGEMEIELQWTPYGFVEQLPTMGWGMLIIMLVMSVLIGGTTLLNKISSKITEAKKQKEQAE